VAECRDKAPRVDVEEALRLFVRINFDVLVGYMFVFEGDPDTLDEGAER
jgi:hypothetical protein